MSYADYEKKLAPGFLQGKNGSALTSTLGAEKDRQLDLNRQAVLADIPGQGPGDALGLIGADRGLPLAGGESEDEYAERLRTSWDGPQGHAFKGSHGGLLFALARAGLPVGLAAGAVIIQRTKLYSYLDSGVVTIRAHNGWTFNTQGPEIWNQFGIVFGADVAGLTVGSPLALERDQLGRSWAPAKARYMGAKIFVTGPFWDWPFGAAWDASGRLWADGITTGIVRDIPPL